MTIKAILFDLDGVLLPLFHVPHVFKVCDKAFAKAFCDLYDGEMTTKEAIEIGRTAFETHGEIVTYPHEIYGIPKKEMLTAHQGRLLEVLAQDYPHILEKNQKIYDALARVKKQQDVQFGIISHACTTSYVQPFMKRAEYGEFIPDENIWGMDRFGFHNKKNSFLPFQFALARMGLAAHEVAFVEDTAANHRYPNAMGMKTVFVDNGVYGYHVKPEEHPYIHRHYSQVANFLNDFAKEGDALFEERRIEPGQSFGSIATLAV